jgi:hypothetical protein
VLRDDPNIVPNTTSVFQQSIQTKEKHAQYVQMLPVVQLEKFDTGLIETGAIMKSLLLSQPCCVNGQHV